MKYIAITLRVLAKTVFFFLFAKQEGHFACFAVFQRGKRAVEQTEGHRGDREPKKGQMVIKGKRDIEGDRGQ
jgi:hypothetical protein